ncbi:hypothetical protein THMIRHAM_11210 [Thiomicrorhabdus immobilis]|uniref:Uncharacterized protein n=1 Tax=Thiomicrorhabdus immobilis TaxID=2791037 RepID=A0ABM7MD78_9GAMM|nr:hypothetical protein [Thiomicrorhabdus immobilis]BCN93336.1 hypothetical protein THMIRHAM_11210 [Thiomicrorhabdus immobilis]
MDNLESFKFFHGKATKLLNSTFAKEMSKPTSVKIIWGENGHVLLDKGPNQEHIDAYLLTFRFFIQNNEFISFNQMSFSFREKINDNELLNKFEEARSALNGFLDRKSNININRSLTHREIMETFIYGNLSHANKRRVEYDSWMQDELIRELMRNEFRTIIGKVLIVIKRVDTLCLEAIAKYDNT